MTHAGLSNPPAVSLSNGGKTATLPFQGLDAKAIMKKKPTPFVLAVLNKLLLIGLLIFLLGLFVLAISLLPKLFVWALSNMGKH